MKNSNARFFEIDVFSCNERGSEGKANCPGEMDNLRTRTNGEELFKGPQRERRHFDERTFRLMTIWMQAEKRVHFSTDGISKGNTKENEHPASEKVNSVFSMP